MPLSCDLMGWRGAGDFGVATMYVQPIFHKTSVCHLLKPALFGCVSAVYFFMGGLLMFLSGILEWVLGNTFPATVFCSFGGFWFAFGGTLNPNFGAYSFYATDIEKPTTGMAAPAFNSSLGMSLLDSVVRGRIPFA